MGLCVNEEMQKYAGCEGSISLAIYKSCCNRHFRTLAEEHYLIADKYLCFISHCRSVVHRVLKCCPWPRNCLVCFFTPASGSHLQFSVEWKREVHPRKHMVETQRSYEALQGIHSSIIYFAHPIFPDNERFPIDVVEQKS